MSVLVFQCTVCKSSHLSKSRWLRHLTSEVHQALAREECVEQWGVSRVKGCCLVVSSSFPLISSSPTGGTQGANRIIQHFSAPIRTFVTDFVCWEDRPHLAIVQFESREMVPLLPGSQGFEIVLGEGQSLFVKRAADLHYLEWASMLPCLQPRIEESKGNPPSPDIIEVSPEPKKRTEEVVVLDDEESDEECDFGDAGAVLERETLQNVDINEDDGGLSPPLKRAKVGAASSTSEDQTAVSLEDLQSVQRSPILEETVDEEEGTPQEGCPFPGSPVMLTPIAVRETNWLTAQYLNIRNSLSLPEEEHAPLNEVRETLLALFLQAENDPSTRVSHYYNWHLKLRNPNWPSKKKLLFYVYILGRSRYDHELTYFSSRVMQRVLESPEAQQHFLLKPPLPSDPSDNLMFKKSSLDFTLSCSSSSFVEAQVCRLLEYMLNFDCRCYPLLTLTFFWLRVNNYTELSDKSPEAGLLPESLVLEWLVIFFFCHKKLIPTVRMIQDKRHTIIKEKRFGIDVGFNADPKFVQDWKEIRKRQDPSLPLEEDYACQEFTFNVIKLFHEFLVFCGNLGRDHYIVNTKDGEFIKRDDFLLSDPGVGSNWTTVMSDHELAALRIIQEPRPRGFRTKPNYWRMYQEYRYTVTFEKEELYMIHPFIFVRHFVIPDKLNDMFRDMAFSARHLKQFIDFVTENGGVQMQSTYWGNLEKVLQISMYNV